MKKLLAIALCTVSIHAMADEKMKMPSPTATGTKVMPAPAAAAAAMPEHMTCGQMMAAESAMPAKMNELMTAIADGMEMHAKWSGTANKVAKGEHDAMMKIAKDHRQMGAMMKSTSEEMMKQKNLASAPHDMKAMDPKMGETMTKQVTLEREMATMMMKDADETEKAVQMMAKAPNGM